MAVVIAVRFPLLFAEFSWLDFLLFCHFQHSSVPTQNPYSLGYAAIITALEGFTPLMTKVKLGNVANLQTPGYVDTRNIKTGAGDRVELRLLQKRLGAIPLAGNSLGVFFRCAYPLEIKSGQMGIDTLNVVFTLVVQALTQAKSNLGQSIIAKWEIPADAEAQINDATARRPDWSAVATIILTFTMSRADFLAATFS